MVVPLKQAQDIDGLREFLLAHTGPDGAVLMYPEMGAVHFMVQRPFVGRFATPTLAWFSEPWHQKWMAELASAKPRFAVLPKRLPVHFESSYFLGPSNRRYFDQVMGYIQQEYLPVADTPSWQIYQRRGKP
jgi:hypothetical protein